MFSGVRFTRMSGMAQQEEIYTQQSLEPEWQATGTDDAAALKQLASERIAAHRRRRAEMGAAEAQEAEARVAPKRGASARVRDAVAARYKESVTYREFLAQEAERALEQAQAEVDMASRKAQAVAEAQMKLLEEMKEWESAPGPRDIAVAEHTAAVRHDLAEAVADIAFAATELQPPALTVRHYEDLSAARPSADLARRGQAAGEHDDREHSALDEEIAFRRAPEFDDRPIHSVGIPGNVIEFPRPLVAPRKVRPRLAEGPLREESTPEPQLRIFEVEPEQVSTAPVEPTGAPEWQSILMEGAPRAERAVHVAPHAASQLALPPQTAPMHLRLMAACVDAMAVGVALVGFVAVTARIAGPALRMLPLPLLAASVAGTALFLMIAYQLLFFTFSEATPGMRYARIAFCTFGDGNPTRKALRRRIFASLLAACPLGLGLAWAWMDEEGLGWHDRISRMYQRAY